MMPSAGPITFAPGAGLPRSRKFGVGSTAGAKSRSSWAAMLFGRVCRTKLRNSGVSTVNVDPRAPAWRRPSYDVKKNSRLRDDRSAEAVAELVLLELRDRRLEDVPGRERVVLEIVRAAAAELVGARLGDHLDLRAAVAAVHRREVVRDDAHFLDRFGVGRQVRDAAARDAVRARVVDGEGVGLVALAAGVDARRGFAGERVVARRRRR